MPIVVGPADGFTGSDPAFSSTFGSPVYPVTTNVRQGERGSLEINTTGSNVGVRRNFPTAPTVGWAGFYLMVIDLANTYQVANFNTVAGSQPGGLWVGNTGLYLSAGTAGAELAIATKRWYWIEMILDVTANPQVLTARVDGVSIEGTTRSAAAGTIEYHQLLSLSGDPSGKTAFYAHWMRGYAAHSQDWLGDPAARRSGWVTRFMDSFERPNSTGPDMGISAWSFSLPTVGTGAQSVGGFGITSRAAVTSGGATDRCMLHKTKLGPDQFAEVEVTVAGTGGSGAGAGLALRSNANGTLYRCVVDKAASNNLEIAVFIDGAYTNLGRSTVSWTDGDVLRFEAQGSTLRAYQNGTLVNTVVDKKIQTGGFAGIAQSSTITSCSLDDFTCGEWLGAYDDEVLRDDPRAYYPMRNLPTDQPTEPQFVGAGSGGSVTSGVLTLTKTGCTAGNVVIIHGSNIVNGGRIQYNAASDNNVGDLSGRFSSGQEMSLIGSAGELAGANGGEQCIAIGRMLVDGTASLSLRSTSGTDALIGRIYEFSGVSKSTALWEVIENLEDGNRYNVTQNTGTSTTIQPGAVSTAGQCRLALAFTALAANAALDPFTGETGGDWTEPVAEYSSASPASSIGLQIAPMRADGRLSGGSDTISSTPWGVVTFALKPAIADLDVGIEFPATPVIDIFTGADETPIATNWTEKLISSDLGARRLSNQFAPNSGSSAGVSSSAYWDVQSFGPDCEIYATLATMVTGVDSFQIWARGSGFGTGTVSGYSVQVSTTGITLYRYVNNSPTSLGVYTVALASGDKIGLRCMGSSIEVFFKSGSLPWQLGVRATDTTHSATGQVGLAVTGTVGRYDDFGGGSICYVLDYSGNGNHAFFALGANWPKFGQPGLRRYEAPPNYSMWLDSGAAPPHQAILSPDSDSADYADIVSLEAWIKRDSTTDGSEMYLVGRGYDGNGSIGLFLTSHNLKLGRSGTDYIMAARSGTEIQDQNVHHVVGTKNGTRRRLYIDGVEVTDYTTIYQNYTGSNPTFAGFTIGAECSPGPSAPSSNFATATSTFDGYIDDAAIYATELSPERIKAHYEAGLRKRGITRVA